MPFSTPAALATSLFVFLSALVAWYEGTFLPRRVTMGFVNHGGMWADLLLLAVANAVILPQLVPMTSRRLTIAIGLVGAAFVVSCVAHALWFTSGRALGTTDHVFPNHTAGAWYRSISLAGWLHVAFMSVQLAVIAGYVVLPMPRTVVLLVTALLTLHIPLANMQPGWYSTGQMWTLGNILPAATMLALMWVAGMLKLAR